MWKYNEVTGKWEWIGQENKQNQLRDRIQQIVRPGINIPEAVELTQEKEKWELENPGLKYEDVFGDKRGYQPATPAFTQERVVGEQAEKLEEFTKKTQAAPSIYADVEDLFGETQSTAAKWANGTLKFAGKTLTATAGGLAMIPGLLYGAATGSFSNVYDNDFQRMLDRANEAMDKALPNYVRREVEDYSILQKMGTANFWANDVLSGMSFVAGAVLTEYLSLGIASATIPSMASRFLRTGLKTGTKVEDALKAYRTLGMTAKETADVLGAVRRLGTGTFYEAGVEARHFANEARENYIQDFIEQNGREPSEVELSEAMSKIYTVANGVFGLNTALVGLSNLVVLPKTFGPKLLPKLASRLTGNTADEVGKGLIKTADLSPTQLKRAAKKLKLSVDEVKAMPFIEKSALRTTTENILRKTYGVLEKPVTEGIFEEMLQGTINKAGLDYVAKYLDTESNLELADIGISFMKGLEETYGSQEGWEEGVIGMIIGGIGLPGKSSTGKGIAMQGGIWDALRDPLKTQRLEYIEKAKNMSSPERIRALIEYAASVKKAAKKYNDALELGDILSAKSAEHESFFSLVNFKMKLNDYESIEDEINQITSEYTDDQFALLFGYENINKEEIAKRKNELKESLLKRARNTKNNILKAQRMVGKDNVYLRDALAYNFSAVENLDAREQDLAERISNILGTIDARSLREIIASNNRIKFKTKWLKTYEEKLKALEEAKAKLASLQTDVDVEQEKIDKQRKLVKEYSEEIEKLKEEEFKARKSSSQDVPAYLRDFEAFSAAIQNIVDLRSKVQDYYFDSLDQKTELKELLQDLQTLAYHRETFIGELNRLFSKEGQQEFNEAIAELKKENRKIALKDQEFWSQAFIQQAVAPIKEGVKVKDVQELFLQNIGIRLQNAGFTATTTDELSEEIQNNTPKAEPATITLDEEQSKIFTTNTVKEWINDFNNNIPPNYEDSDSVEQKIDKLKKIIAYLEKKNKELDLKIKEFEGTVVGEEFKTLKNAESGENIESNINILKAALEQLQEIRTSLLSKSKAVVLNPYDLFKLNRSFLSEEEQKEVDSLKQGDIYNNSYLEFVDYTPEGGDILSYSNPKVKLKKGAVDYPGKALALKVNVNGKEIVVGYLLDPKRFTIDNQQIDFTNLVHLQELNSEFVKEGKITVEGENFKNFAFKIIDIFEQVSTQGKVSLKDNYNLNKTISHNTIKGTEKPLIKDFLHLPEFSIPQSFFTTEKGETIQKTFSTPVIVSNRKDKQFFYVFENGVWRVLNKDTESARIQSLEAFYAKAYKDGLTGQFFILANTNNYNSKEKLFSISPPFIDNTIPVEDSSFIVDRYIDLIKQQNAIENPERGVTLTDAEGNGIFISVLDSKKEEETSSSPTLSLVVDKFKNPILVFEVGDKVIRVRLYLREKNGKVEASIYGNFEGKDVIPINTTGEFITYLNAKLGYKLKKEAKNLNINPDIKIKNFFKRLDVIKEDSDTGEVQDMDQFRSNVNIKITYNVTPPNLTAAKKTSTNTATTTSTSAIKNELNIVVADAINSINIVEEEVYNSPEFKEQVENLKLYIKNENLSLTDKNAYINAIDDAINNRNKKLKDSEKSAISTSDAEAQKADLESKPASTTTSEEASDVTSLLSSTLTEEPKTKYTPEEIQSLQEEHKALNLKDFLGQATEEDVKRIEVLKNILFPKDSNKPDENTGPVFSISETPAKDVINLDVATQNLMRILNLRTPENPNGVFSLQDVKNIMSNVSNNGITWGAYLNKVIYLSKEAGKGTEYHEAFHAVFRSLLSPKQITSYYYAAEKAYGTPTVQELLKLKNSSSAFTNLSRNELKRLWLEEKMADAFKDYAVKKDAELKAEKEKPKGILRILFDKIKKLIGLIKRNKTDLDILFEDIYSGKFRNATPVNTIYSFTAPAFVLLEKPKILGYNNEVETSYLNTTQTNRIISLVASEALALQNIQGTLSQEDIYKTIDEVANTKYNPATYKNELLALSEKDPNRAANIIDKIKTIQDSLTTIQKNRDLIVEEVKKKLALYNIESEEEMSLQEYIENETPERAFDVNIAEIGGFSSLSKGMREFISFTPEYVDEFGFGEFADLNDTKFKSVADAMTIYTGVERVLAGIAPVNMLDRLALFAKTNSNARAFYNHLISQINNELVSNGIQNFDASLDPTNIKVLNNSTIFTAFSQSFNKDKVSFVVAVYDPKSGIVKAFKSNVKDDGEVQIDEWFKNFEAKGLKNSENNKTIFNRIKELFAIEVINQTEITLEDGTVIESFDDRVEMIKKEFEKLGFKISSSYIKHSLIEKNLNLIASNVITSNPQIKPFFEDLLKTYNTFNDVKGISIDDLEALSQSNVARNPFSDVDEDAALGRLKRIAQNNAVFDESVSSTTFQNSEGKTIYSYIQPTFYHREIAKWNRRRNSAKELLNAIKDNVSDSEGARIIQRMLQEEGTPCEMYFAKSMYRTIKFNPYLLGIFNKPNRNSREDSERFTDLVLENLYIFIIDGTRTASLVEKTVGEEDIIVEESYKGSTGVSFGNMTSQGKLLQSLLFFAKQTGNKLRKAQKLYPERGEKKITEDNSIETTPYLISINSDKSTQNVVSGPVLKTTKSNLEIEDVTVEYLLAGFKQEFYRIQQVVKEIELLKQGITVDEDGDTILEIKNYHYKFDKEGNKDYTKGRGLDLFQEKERLKMLDEGLYTKIVNLARTNTDANAFQEIENELKVFIKNNLAPYLFNEFLEYLSSPANKFIALEVDNTLKATEQTLESTTQSTLTQNPKYKNKVLPEYFTTTDGYVDLQALSEFYFNDLINSASIFNLLNGDLAMLYKDLVDVIKRNAKGIAAGPPLGIGETRIAVIKSIAAKNRQEFGKEELSSDIEKLEEQDTTDAQNKCTLDWYTKKYLTATAKYPLPIKNIYKKIQKGYSLTAKEVKELRKFEALANPRKIVVGDRFVYNKMSMKVLLRSETSYCRPEDRDTLDFLYDRLEEAKLNENYQEVAAITQEIHKLWKPIPSNAANHFILNALEANNIDVLAYDSAFKNATPNLGEITGNVEQGFNITLNPFIVADEFFKEQVKTDNIKSEIVDPTQLLNTIFSEQDPNLLVKVLGADVSVKEVIDTFFKLVSSRTELGLKELRQAIFDNDVPKYKHLLKMFKESLMLTGADPYLIEMVSSAEGDANSPKFNLNMPNTIDKIESMFLAFIQKNTLKFKASGTKATLVSDFGYGVMEYVNPKTGKTTIITATEFRNNVKKYEGKVTPRRLKFGKKDSNGNFYSEILITAQTAEQLNLKPGDTLPEELLEMFGVRIPTQDKHSMGYFKVVGFLPGETGNQIVMPYEILKLSGADFDIDSEYLRTLEYFLKGKEIIWFGKYLKASSDEEALRLAREEYIKEKSESYDVKDKKKSILSNSVQYKEALRSLNSFKQTALEAFRLDKEILNSLESIFSETENLIEENNVASEVSLVEQLTNIIELTKEQVQIQNSAKEFLSVIKELNKKLKTIEDEATIEALEYVGYPVSEKAFKEAFGKTISDNRYYLKNGDLNKITPITIGEINNLLVPITGVLIMNESNQEVTKTITSVDSFDSYEERLAKEGIEDVTKLDGLFDATSKHKAAVSNSVGKENIGPGAVFNLLFQRLHRAGVSFQKEYIAKVAEAYADSSLLPSIFSKSFGSTVDNKSQIKVDSNGQIKNESGERINSLIDQIIAAMTDNAKDPKAAKHNLSYSLLGAALLRIGLGEKFDTTLSLQKQPVMVEFSNELSYSRSGLSDKNLSKSKILKELKEKYKAKLKKGVSVNITDDVLIKALKYANDPNSTDLTQEEFDYIQFYTINEMIPSIQIGDMLRNLSSLISLSRGLKPTFSENYDVYTALDSLGLEVELSNLLDPGNIDSYTIKHTKDFEKKKEGYPIDFLNLVKNDPILSNYIKTFHILMKDSSKFFILETELAKKTLKILENNYPEGIFNFENRRKESRRNLLSFLSTHAYRKIAGIYENNELFTLDSLFSKIVNGVEEKPLYIQLFEKLSANPNFENNTILKSLTVETIQYKENNKTGLKGKTLYKLVFNSRTKNNPDFVERLVDSFKELMYSKDKDAKDFAINAFMYLLKKDAGAFKKDTFIRQIAPIFLLRVSQGLDKIQEQLNRKNPDLTSVIGMSNDRMIHEFVELFMRHSNNVFSMKSAYASTFFAANKKSEIVKEVQETLKEENIEATEDNIKLFLAKEYYPIFSDINNPGTIRIDLTKGIPQEKLNSKSLDKDSLKILGINKGVLLSTGIFSKSPDGKVNFPPFFKILTQTEGGASIPTYYKLKTLGTGIFFNLDEKGQPKVDNKYILDADSSNLYSLENINGYHAIYEVTTPILSKEISPWAFTLNEVNQFNSNNEIARNIDERLQSIQAPEVTTNSSTNKPALSLEQIKAGFSLFTNPAITTTPTVETKEEESSSEEDFKPSGGPKFNINKLNQIKFNKPFTPTDDSKAKDSKSSASRKMDQTTLTNTLNRLSNKFGIKWVYDTSIPGLGQFKNGVVLINPNKAKADTPFHEFAHPFIAIVKVQNPALYNNLKNQLINSEIGQKTLAKVQRLYPELSTEAQIEEAIVDVIGQYAANQDEIKKEKGLWNAIKTFLRRVSEYLKDLLSNSNKKIIPSELDPNTTLEEIASMLVIDNPIDLGIENEINYNLKVLNSLKEHTIKPGVQELFESNPELANSVYETPLNNQTVPGDAATLFNNFVNTSIDDVIEAIYNCN